MDIIVTFPKDSDPTKKLNRFTTYWRTRRWPKDTEPGEHIYFVYQGEVRYVAEISATQLHSDKGEIDFELMRELPKPWKKMKGFQGYRYYREDSDD